MTRKKSPILLLFIVAVVSVRHAFPHGPRPHEEKEMREDTEKRTPEQATAPGEPSLEAIRAAYRKEVEPIFRAKCFDCHSDQTRYPWYYRLPGAKQLIDRDIREAHKHMDMSAGFPFKGHGTPSEDLEAIAKVVSKRTMPPLRYILMHWNSRLTEEEEKAILRWAEESRDQL
jgi:hypothetical protein